MAPLFRSWRTLLSWTTHDKSQEICFVVVSERFLPGDFIRKN